MHRTSERDGDMMKRTCMYENHMAILTVAAGFTHALVAQDARFPAGRLGRPCYVGAIARFRCAAMVPRRVQNPVRWWAGWIGTVDDRADGGFPRRLAPYRRRCRPHRASGWSPDGRWIAHASDKGGSTELWLWSVEDGHEIQLTDLGGRINSWSWSPDGRWIAFANGRYGGLRHLEGRRTRRGSRAG